MTKEITAEEVAELERFREQFDRTNAAARALREKNPGLPFVTATIIAQDYYTAEQWSILMEKEGRSAEDTVWMIGSYARLDWAVRHCSEAFVLANLPELWRGSDPDDTDPRYLELWQKAKRRNDGHYLRDGRPLPRRKEIEVYRGQMPADPMGLAWTTNPKIAEKFARGAGARVAHLNGHILRGRVRVADVFAYLTERNEDEVVVDPRLVR